VDFIWVTREQRSLEWFISLLAQMEIEQERLRQTSDKGSLLEVHLYVTSAKSTADLKALNVYLSLDLIGRENSAYSNAIDGIRQRTRHGRPDWDQVKQEEEEENSNFRISPMRVDLWKGSNVRLATLFPAKHLSLVTKMNAWEKLLNISS
jgi:hypothetical protein